MHAHTGTLIDTDADTDTDRHAHTGTLIDTDADRHAHVLFLFRSSK